jgi:hypothetical protein
VAGKRRFLISEGLLEVVGEDVDYSDSIIPEDVLVKQLGWIYMGQDRIKDVK